MYRVMTEDGRIFGRIDADGKIRLQCNDSFEEFREWVQQGNTPIPYVPPIPDEASEYIRKIENAKTVAVLEEAKVLANADRKTDVVTELNRRINAMQKSSLLTEENS